MTSAKRHLAMKTTVAREPFSSRLRRATAYIVVLAAGLYLYGLSEHFQYTPEPGRIGPDAWPKIVLILLIATCAWQIVRITAFGAVAAPPDEFEEQASALATESGNFTYLAWLAVATTIIFAYLMPILGFFVATAIYIASTAAIAGRYRQVVPLLIASLVSPFVLMFVFMRVVYISLPLGQGVFKEFSLVLLRVLGVH